MADSTKRSKATLRRGPGGTSRVGAEETLLAGEVSRGKVWLVSVLSGVLILAGAARATAGEGAPPSSSAPAPAPAAAPTSPGTGPGCRLSGLSEPPKNLLLFDRPSGGRALARLTGGALRLVASDFPAQPGSAPSSLTVDPDGFHIDGFADTSKLSLFAKSRLELVPGHVWIASPQPLTQLGARAGEIQVQARVMSSIQQTFTTWAPCSALALEPSAPSSVTGVLPKAAEGEARLYISKPEALELYPEPGPSSGAPLITITRSGWSDGLVLHGDRQKNGLVHVTYEAELIIDAWAKKSDLKLVPQGELVDQLAAPRKLRASQIKLSGEPVVLRSKSRLDLRLGAQRDASPIGAIEPNTEFYLIDRVAEWARVLPKSLVLTAPDGDPYWVLAQDLDAHSEKPGD